MRVRLAKRLKTVLRTLSMSTSDWVSNQRHVRTNGKIAVVRHRQGLCNYYKMFLKWTSERFPEVRSRMELRLLPCNIRDWSQYALVVPWIPDTLLYRSARVREMADELVKSADANGVPVINRPEKLLGTSKLDGARQIDGWRVRTPWVEPIMDVEGFRRDLHGLSTPLLVRENLAHGGRSPMFLVRRPDEAKDIPLEEFANPIAVEFIDVRDSDDGLVRKYRYMGMGDTGIAHTLQVSSHWEVRSGSRLLNERTISEEIAYTSGPDPHHDILQRIRCGMGLDFLAFDYSLDKEGHLVVWEVNVLPDLSLPTNSNRKHLTPPIERAMAATLKLYLDRAGVEVPQRLEDMLEVKRRDNCDTGGTNGKPTGTVETGGGATRREVFI
jgi:hypothetical protein